MRKVYQTGLLVPVSTYKQALRQHAKFKLLADIVIWKQPIGCIEPYGSQDWCFKPLFKRGIYQRWKGLKIRSNF